MQESLVTAFLFFHIECQVTFSPYLTLVATVTVKSVRFSCAGFANGRVLSNFGFRKIGEDLSYQVSDAAP